VFDPLYILVVVVAFAFAVETALGFGAIVITLSLGAAFMPIDQILPRVVPVNCGLAIAIFIKHVRHAEVGHMVKRVLPVILAGVPLGLLALEHLNRRLLTFAFGAFVVVLSLVELRDKRTAPGERPPLSVPQRALGLLSSGVMQGAFATGGPMLVYVVSREITEKSRFRASLALGWVVLTAALVVSYAVTGRITPRTIDHSVWLLGSLVVGLFIGEHLHVRIPEAKFRKVIYVMLTISGAFLALRSLFG
jgi:uncharacterized protein